MAQSEPPLFARGSAPIKFFVAKDLSEDTIQSLFNTITILGGVVENKVPRLGYVLSDPFSYEAKRLEACWKTNDRPGRYFVPWTFVDACKQENRVIPLIFHNPEVLLPEQRPMRFWVSEDTERNFKDAVVTRILHSGGEIAPKIDAADVILANPDGESYWSLVAANTRKQNVHVESLKWVKQSVDSGVIQFTVHPYKDKGGRRAGEERVPYTPADETHLCKYILSVLPSKASGGRTGNKLYQRLVSKENEPGWEWVKRHPWQSWRERYKKNQERLDKMMERILSNQQNTPESSRDSETRSNRDESRDPRESEEEDESEAGSEGGQRRLSERRAGSSRSISRPFDRPDNPQASRKPSHLGSRSSASTHHYQATTSSEAGPSRLPDASTSTNTPLHHAHHEIDDQDQTDDDAIGSLDPDFIRSSQSQSHSQKCKGRGEISTNMMAGPAHIPPSAERTSGPPPEHSRGSNPYPPQRTASYRPSDSVPVPHPSLPAPTLRPVGDGDRLDTGARRSTIEAPSGGARASSPKYSGDTEILVNEQLHLHPPGSASQASRPSQVSQTYANLFPLPPKVASSESSGRQPSKSGTDFHSAARQPSGPRPGPNQASSDVDEDEPDPEWRVRIGNDPPPAWAVSPRKRARVSNGSDIQVAEDTPRPTEKKKQRTVSSSSSISKAAAAPPVKKPDSSYTSRLPEPEHSPFHTLAPRFVLRPVPPDPPEEEYTPSIRAYLRDLGEEFCIMGEDVLKVYVECNYDLPKTRDTVKKMREVWRGVFGEKVL